MTYPMPGIHIYRGTTIDDVVWIIIDVNGAVEFECGSWKRYHLTSEQAEQLAAMMAYVTYPEVLDLVGAVTAP